MQQSIIDRAIQLRQQGYSLPEISQQTGLKSTTVWRYVHEVMVLPQFQLLLKQKRGGSKIRAEKKWSEAREYVARHLTHFDRDSFMILLGALYWAEGNKKELTFTNTDAGMIRIFVHCLRQLHVQNSDLIISLRIYEDMVPRSDEIIAFWAKTIDVKSSDITRINILAGKKEGKLKYGMCRIRVRKSERIFKVIQSIIEHIKESIIPP